MNSINSFIEVYEFPITHKNIFLDKIYYKQIHDNFIYYNDLDNNVNKKINYVSYIIDIKILDNKRNFNNNIKNYQCTKKFILNNNLKYLNYQSCDPFKFSYDIIKYFSNTDNFNSLFLGYNHKNNLKLFNDLNNILNLKNNHKNIFRNLLYKCFIFP